MRYYVLRDGDVHAPPHIVAEVVRDVGESNAMRDVSFGSPLVCARSQLATREELGMSQEGRAALAAWTTDDDAVFDAETERLAAEPDDVGLRLIQGGAAA